MRSDRRALLVLGLFVTLAAVACGSDTGSGSPAAERPPSVTRPEVLEQVDPDFSESTATFLATSNTKLMIVLHIAVRKDGTPGGVKILRAEPADLPVARAFAEEVAATIPRWRFRPATANGQPMDAEFDFVVEAQGEGEVDAAQ